MFTNCLSRGDSSPVESGLTGILQTRDWGAPWVVECGVKVVTITYVDGQGCC